MTDSNIVHLIEEFEDQDAYDNHQQTDRVQEVEDVLPELLAGEPQIIQLEGADKSILDE